MTQNKCLAAVERRAGGRFVDVDEVLLALFSEPECRDARRWPEVFGHVRAGPPRTDARTFICRALREQIEQLPPEE